MRENVLIESKTVSRVWPMARSVRPRMRPAHRTQAASVCGIASWSAEDSITFRGSQLSRKFCTLRGLIRSGRPLSWSHPKSMMRSAHMLAAWRSDRSSASSEARNSAASSARRSLDQARLARSTRPVLGGSARTRARMNAW